ncbi:MAG: TerB family tellurite resistance protein [Ignavibacteria bacterium]|jgi:uncharacterized tellurite resistance protein B-like protein
MFDSLKNILIGKSSVDSPDYDPRSSGKYQKQIQVATAAIFIELAGADGEFTEEERQHIIHSLKNRFDLEDEYVNELLDLSKKKLDESVSLYEFSGIINENFSTEDKFELLKNLWRLIYTDKKLDKYEDHIIKIIGGMLNMEHNKIINAKMLIRKEQGLD